MFKQYKISKDPFIKGWYIPTKICDDVVEYFNKNLEKTSVGNTLSGPNKKIKNSIDLVLTHNNTDLEIINYRKALQKILEKYIKKFPSLDEADPFNVKNFNIQKYPKKGGYKVWHYERGTKISANRFLVFMTYLNNVKNGGTYFKYQNLITPAEKGLTLIWPPDFTHTHKGQISNDEKIIITGWFEFI